VPLAEADFSPSGLEAITEGFHAIHRQRFAHDDRGVAVEVVALRLTARGRLAKPERDGAEAPAAAARAQRPVLVGGAWRPATVCGRGAVGAALHGPAVIEEAYTSTWVPPGWRVSTHPSGALMAERIA
jgi:N-methylhydantoinase A